MYKPNDLILQKYADLLVKFALGGGTGIKQGETVFMTIPESAKDFIAPLRRSVLSSGGHPIFNYLPDGVNPGEFYELASEEQLSFFPDRMYRGIVDQSDHTLRMLSEFDKYELKGVDSKKLMTQSKAMKPYTDWRFEKENQGKLTWVLASYGTEAMAKDVGMTLEEYWEQIIKACYLDLDDPIGRWKEIFSEQERLKKILNDLKIEKLHVEGAHTDLWVQLGATRKWLGGSGRNIPSFELFVSPDWRGTNGYIYFNQPLYRFGNRIRDIKLVFKEGVIIESSASENEQLLKDMIAVANADKIGEYSLTDSRMSRITKLMGETLFDENFGGEQGNTHLAVGMAYKDSYVGEMSLVTPEQWNELGFNDSAIHTDIISTEKRTVTAYLLDGSTKVIYDNGQFLV
ncbi:MAG: aminopeptidase [bacterium]|nr:aminopeptidase [bacterium]